MQTMGDHEMLFSVLVLLLIVIKLILIKHLRRHETVPTISHPQARLKAHSSKIDRMKGDQLRPPPSFRT